MKIAEIIPNWRCRALRFASFMRLSFFKSTRWLLVFCDHRSTGRVRPVYVESPSPEIESSAQCFKRISEKIVSRRHVTAALTSPNQIRRPSSRAPMPSGHFSSSDLRGSVPLRYYIFFHPIKFVFCYLPFCVSLLENVQGGFCGLISTCIRAWKIPSRISFTKKQNKSNYQHYDQKRPWPHAEPGVHPGLMHPRSHLVTLPHESHTLLGGPIARIRVQKMPKCAHYL